MAPLRKDVNDIYKSVLAKTPKVTPGTYEHIKGDTAVFGYLNWSEKPVATHFPSVLNAGAKDLRRGAVTVGKVNAYAGDSNAVSVGKGMVAAKALAAVTYHVKI